MSEPEEYQTEFSPATEMRPHTALGGDLPMPGAQHLLASRMMAARSPQFRTPNGGMQGFGGPEVAPQVSWNDYRADPSMAGRPMLRDATPGLDLADRTMDYVASLQAKSSKSRAQQLPERDEPKAEDESATGDSEGESAPVGENVVTADEGPAGRAISTAERLGYL
jgi:hypothetical protein